MGLRITSDLGRYLGCPIIHKRVSKDTYLLLVSKAKSKLASWKVSQLALARRATLIKSVTASYPTYCMQVSKLPKDTTNELDKVNIGFLWGDGTDTRKSHLVSWDDLRQPKDMGGICLYKTEDMNVALLATLC